MRRFYLLLALLTLLLAAWLRADRLATLPPGPHYDEAANILITRSIAFGGADLFPIANSYQGRESLYFYLNVPLFHLVGDDVFTLRLSSFYLNMLTIAASMGLARAMFRGQRGLLVALVVGVSMALSFHQVFMSRQAFRAVALPATQALGLFALWRGLRAPDLRRGWPWLLLGGFVSAGALYTYMASRLFPLWLALGGLALLWADRRRWRPRLAQGIVFFGAFALASLPLAIYALQNPDIFFQRLTEVSEGEAVSLGESVRLHLEMFFIHGDFTNLRYNDPGRPYFTWIEAPLLIAGWCAALWHLLRPGDAVARAGYALVVLSPLMVLPSVVAVAGGPPSHMRSLGMVPLIFLAVGLGADAVLGASSRWLGAVQRDRLAMVWLLLALLAGGWALHRDYFAWATRADLFYQADGDLAAAVIWLEDEARDDERVYIASYHREHPTVIAGTDRPVTWLGLDSLIVPPPGQGALLIFSHLFPPPEAWDLTAFAQPVTALPPGPDGGPAFWAYRVAEDRPPVDAVNLPRSPLMRFLGMAADEAVAGQRVAVTTRWLIEQTPSFYRLRPILLLRDDAGRLIAQNDVFLLGTDRWQPGEVLLQQITLDLPYGTPPGTYPLSVLWVDRDTDTFVSYIDAAGAHAGIEAQIGTLNVTRPAGFPSVEVLPLDVRQAAQVAPGLRLVGWNMPPESLRAGAWFDVTLGLQSTASDVPGDDLTLTALLDGPQGMTTIWQGKSPYTPDVWLAGELALLRLRWRVPYDQSAGSVELIAQVGQASVSMGTINVEAVLRQTTAPDVATPVDATFDARLRLHGYTLTTRTDGLQLDMAWQAVAQLERDYTLFVHVIDAQGRLVQQYDAMPQRNQYPTSLWAPGEFVLETVRFDDLPPTDDLTLHLGFYLQESGLRLPVIRDGAVQDHWTIQP